MKIKIFRTSNELIINEWLEVNMNIEIIDIKMTSTVYDYRDFIVNDKCQNTKIKKEDTILILYKNK